jgi:hypothetical protein
VVGSVSCVLFRDWMPRFLLSPPPSTSQLLRRLSPLLYSAIPSRSLLAATSTTPPPSTTQPPPRSPSPNASPKRTQSRAFPCLIHQSTQPQPAHHSSTASAPLLRTPLLRAPPLRAPPPATNHALRALALVEAALRLEPPRDTSWWVGGCVRMG